MKNNNKLNYFYSLLEKNSKEEMILKVKESPLKSKDIDFMCDIVRQLSYKKLMEKYQMSLAGTYQRKVRCIETFCRYLFFKESV